MSITINVNSLSLCHKGSGGISHNTLPNVCKTPGQGVPIPYQNEAYSRDLTKGTTTCRADGGNMIANYGSRFARSVFDEPGSMGGVVSGTHKAEAEWITHSFDVFFEKKAACRLTDKLFMNHKNTVNMGGLRQRNLPKEDLDFYDELCEMACDCWNRHKKGGPEPLQDGETFQECVRKKIDEKYYDIPKDSPKDAHLHRYPKSDAKMWREVSYDRGKKWGMVSSNTRNNPNIPSSHYPWTDTRRLDVARIGKDGKVSKLLDLKFGNDTLDPKAKIDYERIARKHTRSKKNFEEFRVTERCDCDDGAPPQDPVGVPAAKKEEEQEGLLDKFGNALESSTGLKLTGAALVTSLIISEVSRLIPVRNAVPVP